MNRREEMAALLRELFTKIGFKAYGLDADRRVVELDPVEAMTRERPHVAVTEVRGGNLSTVFLGMDHRLGRGGPPLVFETMFFAAGGDDCDLLERYSTWQEAEAGHARFVAQYGKAEP